MTEYTDAELAAMDRAWREERHQTLMRVTAALTDGQSAAVQERFFERNPHYHGAGVADILDVLADHDAHLDVTEDARYGLCYQALDPDGEPGWPSYAVTLSIYALLYATGNPPAPEAVTELAQRAFSS